MWDDVGMARTEAEPASARSARFRSCATSSGRTSRCRATPDNLNQSLEYAGRVADYLEFAELLALDALQRTRIVRRPLPRRKPDARGRGAARRRALHVRRGVGVQGRRASSRSCTRSRSTSKKCTRRSGATSRAAWPDDCDDSTSEGLASGRARPAPGRLVDYAADNVSPDMSFLEMLDVVNEGLIKKRRGRDRVRLGLPRRHLRHVRPRRQRRPARARPRHDGLPAAHAPVQGRRHDHHRAVARQGLPRRQGPRRRSQRVRPHHRGRRLRVGQRGGAPDGNAIPIPKDIVRPGDGLGRRASAAAPAWRPARTRRRTCS